VEAILAAVRIDVVRGNAAELSAIAGLAAEIRGVDSVSADSPGAAAAIVARRTGGAAVASARSTTLPTRRGLPGWRTATVDGSHHRVRLHGDRADRRLSLRPARPFLAATAAMIAFGIAGEIAAERSAARARSGRTSWTRSTGSGAR